MHVQPSSRILFNTPDIELWPACLLRARDSRDARVLSRATQVLRRKRDGAYLAAGLPAGIIGLMPRWQREAGIDDALALLDAGALPSPQRAAPALPLSRVQARLDALGLDADDYTARTGLSLVAEPAWLAFAGFDRYRRPLWLAPGVARAWQALHAAAARAGVALDAVSGYRSHAYQLGIFERKRARGLSLDAILAVNAAPGYSEHHAGSALDISAPDEPPADASFEHTVAFGWLTRHAGDYGFTMSYPRGNPHGIIYEPWHWRYRPAVD